MEEKELINNMKFEKIMSDSLITQPWLSNYKFKGVNMPDGKTGTVYSSHGEEDGQFYVRPQIMEDPDNPGTLKLYGEDFWDVAKDRKFGISFDTNQEAEDFSKWLSTYHQSRIKE